MLDTMYLRTISCLQNTLICDKIWMYLFEIYISQGGLYYFTFNIRLHVKFWMRSKIQSKFGPNVTSELLKGVA
jgi:hypothetical protein